MVPPLGRYVFGTLKSIHYRMCRQGTEFGLSGFQHIGKMDFAALLIAAWARFRDE
jgi:hypothetical protein